MTAAEIKEKAMLRNHISPNESMYCFDEEEMQAYEAQLCKEQREICAEEAEMGEYYSEGAQQYLDCVDQDSILNAKQPEL